MSSQAASSRLMIGFYLVLFFAYLFGPLVIMSITAFNSSSFPRVYPWECFTFEWFGKLVARPRLMRACRTASSSASLVVAASVPLGLAGALLLTQICPARARRLLHVITVADPDARRRHRHLDRAVLGPARDAASAPTTAAPSTTASSSPSSASPASSPPIACWSSWRGCSASTTQLMEAALDLGATYPQAFCKILLPFLQPGDRLGRGHRLPAPASRTTTPPCSPLALQHLHRRGGAEGRLGIDPSISALAVIVIALTLFAALAREAYAGGGQRLRSARRSGGRAARCSPTRRR